MKLTVRVLSTMSSVVSYTLSCKSGAVQRVYEALGIVLVSLTFPILVGSQPCRICNNVLLISNVLIWSLHLVPRNLHGPIYSIICYELL